MRCSTNAAVQSRVRYGVFFYLQTSTTFIETESA